MAVEFLSKWASSRFLELSVYTQTEIGALCSISIRRNVVVTVLTGKFSRDFAFGSQYCQFRRKITPSIVGCFDC